MENKFLPIGTVCTIKGNTNKIMIVGFLSLDYNGNLNVSDYKGCIYPNGLFSSSGTISFNHNDIENIEYIGYKTKLHENLNMNLSNASIVELVKQSTKNNVTNKYVFDKNGVIIMDNSVSNENDNLSNNVTNFNNPFAIQYEGVKQNMETNFKFDENGIIIDDNSTNNNSNDDSNSGSNDSLNYQFDENGMIVEEN